MANDRDFLYAISDVTNELQQIKHELGELNRIAARFFDLYNTRTDSLEYAVSAIAAAIEETAQGIGNQSRGNAGFGRQADGTN